MATTVYEVPTAGGPQRYRISLGGQVFTVRLFYNPVPDGSWNFDLSDADGTPVACGMPLVTGCDLLAQLGYLGVQGRLFVKTDGDPDATATFGGLGDRTHLYLEMDE